MQTVLVSEHNTAASESLVTTLVFEVSGDESLIAKWREVNEHIDTYVARDYPNIKSRSVVMIHDGSDGRAACYVALIISHMIGGEDR